MFFSASAFIEGTRRPVQKPLRSFPGIPQTFLLKSSCPADCQTIDVVVRTLHQTDWSTNRNGHPPRRQTLPNRSHSHRLAVGELLTSPIVAIRLCRFGYILTSMNGPLVQKLLFKRARPLRRYNRHDPHRHRFAWASISTMALVDVRHRFGVFVRLHSYQFVTTHRINDQHGDGHSVQ